MNPIQKILGHDVSDNRKVDDKGFYLPSKLKGQTVKIVHCENIFNAQNIKQDLISKYPKNRVKITIEIPKYSHKHFSERDVVVRTIPNEYGV
jgi:hypothetical protein